MTKLTLNHLANLQNEATAVDTINTNSDTIVSAFDNTLSRDGTTPNQMMSNLDMNSNQIYNLPSPGSATSPARLQDVTSSTIISSVPPTGTSGAVVGFLNGNNTHSGNNTFSGSNTFTGTNLFTNAAPITVGANGGNNGLINFKGSASGTTVVQATAAASGTLTLPVTTDTLTGKATADVLTNKTYDTAGTGNIFKINGTGISAVTGTGSVVLATSPTITSPTIVGITNGTLAGAGNVGEVLTNTTTGVSISTGVAVTATSLTLTAGDWDISGAALWPTSNTGTAVVYCAASISLVNNTMNPTIGNIASIQMGAAFSIATTGITIPSQRVNISTPTTFYLVTQSAFSTAGGSTVQGYLYARRRR